MVWSAIKLTILYVLKRFRVTMRENLSLDQTKIVSIASQFSRPFGYLKRLLPNSELRIPKHKKLFYGFYVAMAFLVIALTAIL